MMRWKPNITICDTLAGKCCSPRFQNVCDVRPWQGTAVGPSHAQHFEEEKRKKGADATTNRTAVGQSLASNHACPLGDIWRFWVWPCGSQVAHDCARSCLRLCLIAADDIGYSGGRQ